MENLENYIKDDGIDKINRVRNDDEIEVPGSVWENEKNRSHPYLVLMPETYQGNPSIQM